MSIAGAKEPQTGGKADHHEGQKGVIAKKGFRPRIDHRKGHNEGHDSKEGLSQPCLDHHDGHQEGRASKGYRRPSLPR